VLLSARRVARPASVRADMTTRCSRSPATISEGGTRERRVFEGRYRAHPTPEASVDVIISNCVINLRPTNARSWRGVSRAQARWPLCGIGCRRARRAAGRGAAQHGAVVGCVAGALTEAEFTTLLGSTGFEAIGIEPTRSMRSAAGSWAPSCGRGSPSNRRVPRSLSLHREFRRSQLAEALLNWKGRGRFHAESAAHTRRSRESHAIETLREYSVHGLTVPVRHRRLERERGTSSSRYAIERRSHARFSRASRS